MSQELLDIEPEVENFNFGFEDDGIYGDNSSTASANPQAWSTRPIFMSKTGNQKETHGQYIEDFNPESLAGAAWGQEMPVFEYLCLKQEQAGSHWNAFHDEEEWELAEWLVKNVGQKQTNMFLKMCIVSCFSNLKSILLLKKPQIKNRTNVTYDNNRSFLKLTKYRPKVPDGLAIL